MATNIRRALFIGLGGTGMTTLLHTKKIIYDNYGEIPPMLAFLGVDTDNGAYSRTLTARNGEPISLATAEQLRISVPNPSDIYSVGKQGGQYGWVAPGNANALTVLNRGAGQIRSNGRFAITVNENAVRTQLQAKMNQITNAQIINNPKYNLLNADIDVHVIFSLSGGTGGGTFINLAYLLKTLFPECKVSGYAVMGEVFHAMLNGAPVARVRNNSYGAIMDLDYLMSLTPDSKGVGIEWFNSTSTVTQRPFNALYLVDNKNGNGDTYVHVDYISEMISLALVTSIGQLGVATDSVADNVEQNIAAGLMDTAGKSAWVSGLGVSEIVYKGESLAQIYANKARQQVVTMITNGGCDDPSNIANTWIDQNKIRENLGQDNVIDYFSSPQPDIPFTDISSPESPKTECDNYINNLAQEKPADLDQKLKDLEGRIEKALEELIDEQVNRPCGAYLCENILKTLLAQFQLCDGEMKNEIENKNKELVLLRSTLDTSQKELADLMHTLLKSGKTRKIEAVCNDAINVAVCMREIKRREMARTFYAWLIAEVNNYIAKVDVMLANLKAVNDKSTNDIVSISHGIDNNSLFEVNLAVGMKDKVDCPATDIVFNDFVKMMQNQGGLWKFASDTSDEVARFIWDYTSTLPKAQEYLKQTVDDILKTLGPKELNRTCDMVIKKAQPLLQTDNRGYFPQTAPDDSYYVGVTAANTSVLNNNNFFKQHVPEPNANVNIVPIGLEDRVIIFHQYGVVPAFMVGALATFKPSYDETEANHPGTSHWDYGLYRRFKTEHFDIMPQNPMQKQQILDYWVQALLFGLITKNDKNEFFIVSKTLGGKTIKGFKVKIGAGRFAAYTYFAANISVFKDEMDKRVNDITNKNRALPGQLKDKAKQEVNDGVYHLIGHLSLSDVDFSVDGNDTLYPDEYALLDDESTTILAM